MLLISHGISDIGCLRSENQDRILLDDGLGLYVVCDGVGGRRRGDLAAEITVQSIREFVESSADPMEVTWPYGYNLQMSFAANRVLTAVKLANRQVWRRGEDSLKLLGMGATAVAVLVDGNTAAVANVGDARAYLFRDASLEQVSIDDTARMHLARPEGNLVERSVLTCAVGVEQNIDVHVRDIEVACEDILLLCSDGLTACVPPGQIAELLAAARPVSVRAQALIDAARAAGAPDNASAVLLHFRQGDTPQ